MHTLHVTNVNQALVEGVNHLQGWGNTRPSRNGPALVAPWPVTTIYTKPWERVLLIRPEANPFFHLVESVWMLAGRDDVETVARYVSRMRTFSDDGIFLNGAYGYRWRHSFGIDQLLWTVNHLKKFPDSRRAVIEMYDAAIDQRETDKGGKDIPCNTHIYPYISHNGTFCMTVCCRSNDIIWGAYGANAVHFSVLQEVLASTLGCEMGPLYQVSNNYHAYTNMLEKLHLKEHGEPYPSHQPIIVGGDLPSFLQECELLLQQTTDLWGYQPRNEWLRTTVRPAMLAHAQYKQDNWSTAFSFCESIAARDWRTACEAWLTRMQEIKSRAKDDGVSHD